MRRESCLKHVFSIFLACSILSMCSVGTAQVYRPSSSIPWGDVVRSPGRDSGSNLDIELLWLRPTSTKLFYLVVDPYSAGPDSIRGSLKGLEYGYAPGFRLVGTYGMGNYAGMEMAYTHFSASQDASKDVKPGEDLWGLLLHANSIIDDNDVTNVWTTAKISLNEGSVGSRVSFAFGSSGNISLSAGVQYTNLKQELDILYMQDWGTGNRRVYFTRENSLSGFGPCFSLGTRWNMGGVNLFGEIGAAMLVSTIGGHVRQHDFPNGSINGTMRVDVDCDYGTRVVPAASMKLGVGYDNLSNWGLFSFRCGYEVHNYFNAISTYEQYDDVDSQLGANDQSDIGINGFFLTISAKWAFTSL
jgi:hypothetical protein